MTLTIMESINKTFEGLKNFVVEKGENPVFWIVAFFLGIALFWFTYGALHKDR